MKLLFRRNDELSCRQVGRVIQQFLDGESDDVTTELVADHLDACRRCGLDADTYLQIKAALARSANEPSAEALERLREFGARLVRDAR